MSKESWFKDRRKQIITHSSIVVGFVLLTFFVITPLFDHLERIPGESEMRKIMLPAPTNNVLCCFDYFVIGREIIDARGWAFISGEGSEGAEIYLVFESDEESYVFTTMPEVRKDVTRAFSHLKVNADSSGFTAAIPLRKIAHGEYIVGVYIKKSDIEALQYIDKAIVKTKEGVKEVLRTSIQQQLDLPPETRNIRFFIDADQEMEGEGRTFLQIKGWAFIEGQDASGSTIYVALKSAENTYVFDTILDKKPTLFSKLGLNLDNSGFIARIPKETIEAGTYQLGIYIKKGNTEAFQYCAQTVLIK